ncbi:MAG: DNA-directed RNA polymerase subunit beta [Ruminococcaceae bacterium]|nr:DNA-directed RNA polymerase subunit beta [Oscillospiraceae bacterium]
MLKPQKLGTNVRMSFSKIDEALEMPNLIEVQKKSFKWFLEEGMFEVLKDVSPIVDYSGNLVIEFVDFSIDSNPRYSVEECKDRDATYEAPLKVSVRLTNKETGELKQSDIYMGNFPLMTDNGTFVINGAERVIVSQLVRSPGIYYVCEVDKSGNHSYKNTVIPYRGAWLEYETDASNVFYVKIDKTRKIPITVLIRALGEETDNNIIEMFGDEEMLRATFSKDECAKEAEENHTTLAEEALKEIYRKLRPGEPPILESAQLLVNNLFFDPKRYDLAPVGRYKFDKKLALAKRIRGLVLARPVVSVLTGELIADEGEVISRDLAEQIEHSAVNEVYVISEDGAEVKVFANGTIEPQYVLGYDLKDCGINEKVRYSVLCDIMAEANGDAEEIKKLAKARIAELCPKHITKDDIFSSINYLLNLTHGIGSFDDIDHLGNRRLRCVGELLQNQMRIGMSKMDKNIKERMSVHDSEDMTPQSLINTRPVATAIREFFGSSPLSQFMDQNNPLAELTHKRRLSALGPGGLSRDRASFDVRDVHYTHYGRMCPIETPEGPNIGLISYLATYAKINDYGFLEAPYRKVDKATGRVTNEIEYMTADIEDSYIVAQANEKLDENGCFVNKRVIARDKSEIIEVDRKMIDYMDASPKMVVSVATAMIPFLENDDNTRALMGSNMQKQAVPLMMTDSPYVATGMEYKAAVDSGTVVVAKEGGIVERVDSDSITILTNSGKKETYHLIKFKRSNQGTCVNQRPVVKAGQQIEDGQVIADGPATSNGEISLGKNALIGFMTWEGYNYEDAVLLNEKLVREDTYTSIHIEEHSVEARDTKLGPQEITREVPNVGDDALKDLDEDGIVKIGTEVRAGDILVGKVTPKGETELTPEERLLRAIFGEKAREVRDSSLRLPHGESGIVVDVKVFDRSNSDDLAPGVNKVVRVYIAQKRKISVGDKMAGRHGNKGVVSRILPPEDMPFLADGTPLDIVLNPLGVPSRMNIGQVLEVHLGLAAKKLGMKIMTPVFDGANEKDIIECLREAGYARDIREGENVKGKALFIEVTDENGNIDLQRVDAEIEQSEEKLAELRKEKNVKVIDGKMTLYDGRTGDPFDNPVTVGIMYYLKLHHLVDDKIHARSNGPYSLVTQQPLGGKAQFGGQRFGEMEVWALEAYGAAYTLQEILTVKSDDVTGRVKTYEAIVKGQNIPTPGIPESFKVLVKELQSLALDIRVLDDKGEEIELSQLVDDDDGPELPAIEEIEDLSGGEVSDEDIADMETAEEDAEEFFSDEFTDEFDEAFEDVADDEESDDIF